MRMSALSGRQLVARSFRNHVAAFVATSGVPAALFPGATFSPPAAQPLDWTKVVAAAHKEGRVVLYATPTPPVLARLKADFEKAYPGIVLEVNRMVGDALILKVETERGSNVADGADVVLGGELVWLEKLAKERAIRPPAGPAAKAWPNDYLIQG